MSDREGEKHRGRTLLIAGCGCAGLLGIVGVGILVGTWIWTEGGPPSAFAGEHGYEAVLTSDQGDGSRDGEVILRRLESLGVEGEIAEAGPGRMVLRVHDVVGPEVIDMVAPRRELALHLEAPDARSLMPSPETFTDAPPDLRHETEVVRQSTVPTWVGPSAEALAPILARVPAGRAVTPLVECGRAEWSDAPGEECRVRLVESEPLVTGADVVDAQVTMDEVMGTPQVIIDFSEDATQRFSDGTARGAGRRLAIVVDNRIESFPVIMERISGGRAMITPAAMHPGGQMEYAQAMAAAFRSGVLASPWQVASVSPLE